MKKFFVVGLMISMVLASTISEADARRMGGGRSFGRQSQSFNRFSSSKEASQNARAAQQKSQTATSAPVQNQGIKSSSPWKGILGGALLGLGFGALLSHLGLGGMAGVMGNLLMIILLAGAVYFLYSLFRRKVATPTYSGFSHSTTDRPSSSAWRDVFQGKSFSFSDIGGSAGGFRDKTPEIGSALNVFSASVDHEDKRIDIPVDFDQTAFLHHAKTNFIRLQAAWDKENIDDIKEFTTFEIFSELKKQLEERGTQYEKNITDVVSINAELLGIEKDDGGYLAAVRFSGMIKENQDANAHPFTEVWNLLKPLQEGRGWLLGGIEQQA